MGTAPPSAHWLGFSQLDFETTPWAVAAGAMFSSLDRLAIREFISSLRHGISCEISPQFTNGTQHLVFEVSFSDDLRWIARLKIRRDTDEHFDDSVKSQACAMKLVRERTRIPVPDVYAWDSGSQNVFGAPYIVMEAISGRELHSKDPLFQTFREKILDQMASILIELSTIRFDTIGDIEQLDGASATFGTPNFTSSRDYYTYYLDKDLQRSESIPENEKEKYIMENENCRRLLNQISLTDGPYPLTHFDFGIFNVLVDDGGDIVGVIDWSGVGVYPWEVFAQYPEPLRITWPLRAMYSEQNWKQHIEDQRYFKEALRKCERDRGLPEIISSVIGSESKLIAEGILGIGFGPERWRKRWMDILEGIELRTKNSLYTTGSITFEEVRKM